MSRLVVDASVVAKLYFPEVHSEQAEAALRRKRTVLLAPDLLHIELASIAWKRLGRGDIDAATARMILSEGMNLPITVHLSTAFIAKAMDLAIETQRSVCDCVCLAVAIAERATLLTADDRFVSALRTGPFTRHICWIGED